MRSVLITGGAGYIGSHIAKSCLDSGWNVFIIDNLSRGFEEPVKLLRSFGNVKFFNVDIREKEALLKVFEVIGKEHIDTVIHCAAFCSVGESMKEPGLYFDNNVGGTINLLSAMKKHKIKKIVFSSSCATYGEAQYLPIDEKHPQVPVNPYGESKRMAEELIKWEVDFRYVILRYFNVCGADYMSGLGDSKKPSVHLIQNIVRGVLDIEDFKLTSPKVETKDGSPIRDYLDVRDLAVAHIKSVSYLDGNKSSIFNLGTGHGYSNLEIIKKVERVLACKIPINEGNTRPGEYAQVYASNKKAKTLLDWNPTFSLENSIKSLAKWYESKPHGYKR